MDNERKVRLTVVGCQTAALVVVVAMLAGQYQAMTAPVTTQDLPATGSIARESKLGFIDRLRLRRTVQDRYNQLSQLEGLTPEQQQQLAAIAEALGD